MKSVLRAREQLVELEKNPAVVVFIDAKLKEPASTYARNKKAKGKSGK